MHDVMTLDQAAGYLQVSPATVARYIRQGRLAASRLGRRYRIPRRSLELLLWTTRARADIPLREYTVEEIDTFLRADELDDQARTITERFTGARVER